MAGTAHHATFDLGAKRDVGKPLIRPGLPLPGCGLLPHGLGAGSGDSEPRKNRQYRPKTPTETLPHAIHLPVA
ncbi:hypothetical protein GOX01_00200 [Gluconobacter oxydans]|nr:hypothetical protein GOX01_00200 [Gluconobacter oxydans]